MQAATLREATVSDAEGIIELIRELARYEALEHEVSVTKQRLEECLFTAHPRAFALVAELDGALAGFCLYFYNFSTFLGRHGIYIEDLFVREPFRGLGIGKQFFRRLAEIAQAKDCGRIEWWVLDWNKPAIDFYASLGAEAMSQWSVYRLSQHKFAALLEPARAAEGVSA